MASVEDRSTTSRSGPLSRNTVKVGARVPVTTTWAPVPCGVTRSSFNVFSSALSALAPPTAAIITATAIHLPLVTALFASMINL